MVARDLSEPECSFCGAGSDEHGALPVAAPLERLMDIAISACEFFYGDANNEGVPCEMWDEMVVSAADVLDHVVAGDVNDHVLEAMKDAMNDRAWVSLDYGMGSQLDALRFGWRGLVQTIKHHSRFTFLAQPEPPAGRRDELNTQEFLQAVFEILWEYDRVEPLDVTVQLWRGRMVAEASKADGWSAKDFGSPPARKATANRMSPAGISMFYGSDSIDTVVAEIGAHWTHRYAAVASFVPSRPLKVLNLVDLPPSRATTSQPTDGTTSG